MNPNVNMDLIMYQYSFVSLQMYHIDAKYSNSETWEGESISEFPLFFARFFCKPKASLKKY